MKKIILLLLALLASCNETPVDGGAPGDSTVVEPKAFQEAADLIGSQVIVGVQLYDSAYRIEGGTTWEPLKYAPMTLVDTLGYQTLRMTCWFPEGGLSACYDLIQHPVYYPLEKLESLEETERGYHVVATTHWVDQETFGGANNFMKLPRGLDIPISMDITVSKNTDTTVIIMCMTDTPKFCADADSIATLADSLEKQSTDSSMQDGVTFMERAQNMHSLAYEPCQWLGRQFCLDILAIRDPDL